MNLETKAGLIMAAIQEDRAEIRTIRYRIYSNIIFITVASFAITPFLIGEKAIVNNRQLLSAIDIALLAMLWITFWSQKTDLDSCHLWMESRERMLTSPTLAEAPFDPFKESKEKKPRIRENSLYWVVAMATLAIIFKMAVIHFG